MAIHTDKAYEADLHRLREELLRMGGRVEEAIRLSMRALITRDIELAQRVSQGDREINRQELEIDDLCLRILALRQPAASDLRFIALSLKIVTDLERTGDCAAHIADRARELATEPQLIAYDDLTRMAEVAERMVRDVLDAFVRGDASLAQQVIERDDAVDQANAKVFGELLDQMTRDPARVPAATRLQSISKFLERVGDHATNVAEMVVFMVLGKDIRHPGSRAT